jgi:hypothetical protein
MCEHCVRDMTACEHRSQAEHDLWLFPHGRAGYSDVTSEAITAAQARCPYCRIRPFLPETGRKG